MHGATFWPQPKGIENAEAAETQRGIAATKVPGMKIHAKNDSLQISSEWWRERADCAPMISVYWRSLASLDHVGM